MSLEEQVLEKSKEIATDAYSMSVGELLSLYKDGELDIHPEFQRFFRWTPEQKSKFIESVLLGIPVPSFFVSQKQDGSWDVIDGLQRLSTIFQLTGDLRDEKKCPVTPLVLEKTAYLPDLQGKLWESDDPDRELPQSAKLKIKRARLDLKIVMNTSDESAKYELFQRLNTGGSLATAQEVRNCLLIMLDQSFYNWFAELGQDEHFRNCLPLSERMLEERYDLELVTRFLSLRTIKDNQLNRIGDLGSFLTERIVSFAQSEDFDRNTEAHAFRRTFHQLDTCLGENAFKKFDPDQERALGPFLISVFEVMAVGMGCRAGVERNGPTREEIVEVHRSLWTNGEFLRSTGSGVGATRRIPVTVRMGREFFE